jgi:DNA-binding NtrC family response regulator
MERMTILRVFEQVQGDKILAGRLLGISRATLYRKLKRYQIPLRPSHSATHHVMENHYVSETGSGR